MFEDLLDDADDYLNAIRLGKQALEEILVLMDKLNREISIAQTSLESLQSPDYAHRTVLNLIFELEAMASEVFKDELADAIAKRSEFNYEILSEPLLEVAQNKNLVRVKLNGQGWDASVKVMVDLNRVAGTLEDWARGVQGARQAVLGKKPRPYDPDRASKYWREKVYGLKDSLGLYKTTIGLRLMYAGTPAPYWQLLDQGTTPLDSDRGGSAYPVNKPTNFVRKTISRLENYFLNAISDARSHQRTAIRELRVTINTGMEYWTNLDRLYREILNGDAGDMLEPDDDDIDLPPGGGIGGLGDGDNVLNDHLMMKIEQEMGHYKGKVDYYKVSEIVVNLMLDLPVPLTSEGRIEVTAPDSPTRVRPHINVFLKLLGK